MSYRAVGGLVVGTSQFGYRDGGSNINLMVAEDSWQFKMAESMSYMAFTRKHRNTRRHIVCSRSGKEAFHMCSRLATQSA